MKVCLHFCEATQISLQFDDFFFTKTIQNNNLAIIRKDDAKICENETFLADFQTLLGCSFTKIHPRYAELTTKKPHCISTC